jgi:two-component system LytT family response regulator
MLSAVIIDDEEPSGNYLKMLIEKHCPDVRISGTACSLEEGHKLISRCAPDVVLLDIMLANRNGFELLALFPTVDFEVIFTTAYDEYAIQAIRASAVDYLLKPVKSADLQKALEKAAKRASQKSKKPLNKVVIKGDQRNYLLVQPSEIIRIEANGKKLSFILTGNRKIDTTENLSSYEDILNGKTFFRTHRSHIINLDSVIEFLPDRNGGFVRTSDQKLVPLALSKKDEFSRIFLF